VKRRPVKRSLGGLSSVAKALNVLEYVGSADRRSLSQIAAQTKMPKSTLLRLLGTLIDFKFLRRTGHGEYAAALKLWRIGCTAIDYETLRANILPVLQRLVKLTSETALYAVYDDGYATYVEKVEGLHPIRAYTTVGGRSPAYASATGKALLAWRGEAEIARLGAQADQLTEATHVGADNLLRHAADIRRAGVAVNRGEWRTGVWGVAAPVFGRDRVPVGAIAVSGPREHIEPQLDRLPALVRAAAQELSAYDATHLAS